MNEESKTGLIYIIKNDLNNKVYIGQTTTNIQTRFHQHCKNSTLKNRHYKIYNAIKKYGKEHFICEIIEDRIPIKNLDQREICYIEKFNSFYNGYNSTKGGDGRTINKHYDEQKIIEMYKNGKNEKEIAGVYNVSDATISRCLKKLNIETRKNGNKYEQFDIDKFKKMWKSRNTFVNDIATYFNVDKKTIYRHAKRLKLNRKGSMENIPLFDIGEEK